MTVPARIIAAYTPSLGGAPEHFGLHPLIINEGWESYVEGTILPDLAWAGSSTAVLLHLPHGRLPVGDYRLDMFQLAERAGLKNVADHRGFVRAMKLIQGEKIIYLGVAKGNPAYEKLKRPGFVDNWETAMEAPVNAALDAGCSLAFDKSSDWKATDPEFLFFESFRRAGVKCYVESPSNKPHFAEWGQICMNELYQHRDATWFPENPLELVRWPHVFDRWSPETVAETVRGILADGHSCACALSWLKGIKIDKWFGGVLQ